MQVGVDDGMMLVTGNGTGGVKTYTVVTAILQERVWGMKWTMLARLG
jgi:hypothetical protein